MAKGNARTPKTTIPVDSIPEVQALVETEKAIADLISSNPDFYRQLCELVEERNTVLQAAEKLVRATGSSCGPFLLHSSSIDIDVEKLWDELGEEDFNKVGGYTEKITIYKVDRTRFLTHLEAGQIPDEVKESCTELKRSYKKPDPYKLP